MAKKRNIIVGQSGGPTSVINSSLAGVYKNAVERGFDKVYGMLHGIQGLLDEQYIDLSTPVSYTHLDVYKRQGWGLPEESKPRRSQNRPPDFPGSTLYHAVHCKLAHDEAIQLYSDR